MDGVPLVLLLLIALITSSVHANSCSYKGCHQVHPRKLNIHLVAHTHDDVGWLKTVDQYYYGSNKGHAPFGVQYILDSVVSELLKNKDRRFVYVESSFLWRWWEEQDQDSRNAVLNLVNEGRLQLVHGGWCMSDEATPHYSAMIDQMTLGLKFLNETFGECGIPAVAWQIDPFGHSAEVALEFAQMGYDGLFFGRIDHEDYKKRVFTNTMETIWRPDTSTGIDGELFSGVLYNLYMPPSGFCFDTYCNDEPIMDNPKLHGYNVDKRVNQFVKEVRLWAEAYKTNNVMVTMGGDFNYIVASSWFKNMDKLIKYVNSKISDVNVVYSTPACYLKALHDANITWPVNDNDDFFPYGSDEHSYWTGYFTSRPSLKNMVYRANNLLQATKQLRIPLGSDLEGEQLMMQRAVGISQHHDALSGTEKQHVADDYALYLYEGIEACQKIFSKTYKKWLGSDLPDQNFCPLLNISQCDESENASKFIVTIYNPLAHTLSIPVRIPVMPGSYKVTSPSGIEIASELVPVPEEVKLVPGRQGNTTLELVFLTEDLPPLGLLSYHIERSDGGVIPSMQKINLTLLINNTNVTAPLETSQEAPEDIEVDNGILKLIFNSTNGQLQYIVRDGETWAFNQNFYYYEASKGYNYNSFNRASGAYIFRPNKNEADLVSDYANISVYKGKSVTEVHQQFGPWVSQIIRLYLGKDQIEFNWMVGPISVEKWIGKEVITRYKTQLLTASEWYTDSNGRRLMRRVRNQRKTWNLTLTEPIASNYYPATSAAIMLGNKHQVTVITDRPQGASSMIDGELEIMLHRRLLYDDNKGVSEQLDETQYKIGLVTRGCHIVQLSKTYKETKLKNESVSINETTTTTSTARPSEVPYKYREGAQKYRTEAKVVVYGPLLSFVKTDLSAPDWKEKYKTKFDGILSDSLPINIHLLTLERWQDDSVLLRLEHIFEASDHPFLSQPVSIALKTLLRDYEVTNATELTLAANQEKLKLNRLVWNHQEQRVQASARPIRNDDLIVILQPMEIRTFLLFVTPRNSTS